ncbi:SPOR domain-containing protein [Maritimibacter sp. 55A14]|uniref:SPOR domain-containing protein n=1 Tax=Maritimibacter sp. 55A14 TaxID=2174844 RepID=UPI000D608314|nr:SPOR domain-containing protein [Maritimibacter sp. 55A14]PWE30543.1 SPOR domain-containing protein [Maritimibacter sp. 55A14]
MTGLMTRNPFLICVAALVLAGCEDFKFPGGGGAEKPAEAQPSEAGAVQQTERDVEAPEVFHVAEEGLWDGRPSLGGVWVTHPDVKEPERVMIRNPANDSFVIGALFKRERENPGPRLMVSSDAASALGILAGQPTQLDVTALRRETVELPAEPAAVETASATETGTAATPEVTEAALEPMAAAAAAIDEAEAGAAAAPAPEAAPAAAPQAVSSLSEPYIQIGFFSVEENADTAAAALRKDGIVPTIRKQESSGKTYWRVVVGPATNRGERSALLSKIKALGYSDAYFVKN